MNTDTPLENSAATSSKRGLIKPDGRLLWIVGIWLFGLALTHLSATLAGGYTTWLWVGAALVLVTIYDAWQVLSEDSGVTLRRELPQRWPVNSPVNLGLIISHRGHRPLELVVHDLYPQSVHSRGLPLTTMIATGDRHTFHWQATATERGPLTLPGTHLAWRSPLGLWWRRVRLPVEDSVKVYPNFNLIVQYGRLAGDRRLEELGIHLQQRRGTGSDFHQLRDHREGDSLRQIDWHATSRMRKLIAKDYQEERDQRVVFLLDCSRRMRAMDGPLSHFDQCLNAMLLLSHVALKQGDEIALQTMAAADGRDRLLPPGRGQRQFGALLETVYDLDAGLTHPDYLGAASALMKHQRRRSLVILLTNLRDEVHDELDPALALMRQRHLVVLADLRETLTDGQPEPARGSRTERLETALLRAGSVLYQEKRRTATRHLRQLGIIHLDIEPDRLPGALVSQYRTLKASGIF